MSALTVSIDAFICISAVSLRKPTTLFTTMLVTAVELIIRYCYTL